MGATQQTHKAVTGLHCCRYIITLLSELEYTIHVSFINC